MLESGHSSEPNSVYYPEGPERDCALSAVIGKVCLCASVHFFAPQEGDLYHSYHLYQIVGASKI